MAGSELVIREAQPGDAAQWRALWHSYLEFYEAELADEVTARRLYNQFSAADDFVRDRATPQ